MENIDFVKEIAKIQTQLDELKIKAATQGMSGIGLEEVKKLNEPKLFMLYGKEHHFKSVLEDLKEYGFSLYESATEESRSLSLGYLRTNATCHVNQHAKENYFQLVSINQLASECEKFYLPNDYGKFLDFIKEQLECELLKKVSEKNVNLGNRTMLITSNKLIKGAEHSYQIEDFTSLLTELKTPIKTNFKGYYGTRIETINMGCVKGVKIEEIEELIKVYKELNNEQ